MSARPISEVAAQLGLAPDEISPHGTLLAKIPLGVIDAQPQPSAARLILVTAMSPTPAGEGKTTVTIGLADALALLGHRVAVALREPSLGPVLGLKGGATGGGLAQLVPATEINLHFTGDIHAVTSANALIAALLDNHLQHGNELDIDPRRIRWQRALDMNDRALRQVVVGLGGPAHGVPREDSFQISAASEVMAVLAMASGYADLKRRLGRMLVAFTRAGDPVTVADLGAAGPAAVLLREALSPNLVQTLAGTPVLMHAGPFANIALGCNSVIATRAALRLADVVVTEAGFGADLGGEKFLNIKARELGRGPDVAVLVATVRAVKLHGGVSVSDLSQENLVAMRAGFSNLARHLANLAHFGLPVTVAINRFDSDTEAELALLSQLVRGEGHSAHEVSVFQHGGQGALGLAAAVVDALAEPHDLRFSYGLAESIASKVTTLVRSLYGGAGVRFTPRAQRQIALCVERGWDQLPVCVAKTQYSFSDDPKALGAPTGFEVVVADVVPRLGPGYLVIMTGSVLTMPGLPKHPQALQFDLTDAGEIVGG